MWSALVGTTTGSWHCWWLAPLVAIASTAPVAVVTAGAPDPAAAAAGGVWPLSGLTAWPLSGLTAWPLSGLTAWPLSGHCLA